MESEITDGDVRIKKKMLGMLQCWNYTAAVLGL